MPKFKASTLRYSPECILKAVLSHKNLNQKPEIPLPTIYYESTTPLSQFQAAVVGQWNVVPQAFTNVYVMKSNEIYVTDDAVYYGKYGRFLDDSVAHELTHYIQFRYQGWDLAANDDAAEGDAVDAQTWFRETFMANGATLSPCP